MPAQTDLTLAEQSILGVLHDHGARRRWWDDAALEDALDGLLDRRQVISALSSLRRRGYVVPQYPAGIAGRSRWSVTTTGEAELRRLRAAA